MASSVAKRRVQRNIFSWLRVPVRVSITWRAKKWNGNQEDIFVYEYYCCGYCCYSVSLVAGELGLAGIGKPWDQDSTYSHCTPPPRMHAGLHITSNKHDEKPDQAPRDMTPDNGRNISDRPGWRAWARRGGRGERLKKEDTRSIR